MAETIEPRTDEPSYIDAVGAEDVATTRPSSSWFRGEVDTDMVDLIVRFNRSKEPQ